MICGKKEVKNQLRSYQEALAICDKQLGDVSVTFDSADKLYDAVLIKHDLNTNMSLEAKKTVVEALNKVKTNYQENIAYDSKPKSVMRDFTEMGL